MAKKHLTTIKLNSVFVLKIADSFIRLIFILLIIKREGIRLLHKFLCIPKMAERHSYNESFFYMMMIM